VAVDAGTIYSDVRVQLDKLKGDINKITTEYDKLGKNITQTTKDTETKAKKSFGEINLAGLAAFTGISIAIKKSITSFANFEQSLANVQSVARATPKEFEALEAAAAKAGETTRFTASQAADALYALASAGLDAKESTAALDGVLALAAATQSDLAFSAQTVTAALSQFGLEAEDSTKVANVFSAAIANSQANMEKLSAAFRQVGPVAGTLGISLEETTGALQALFNAGFRGEQAGTVLRNVLSQLADTTGPVSKKLKDLGVDLEGVNPTANSLIDVIGNLSDANLSAGEAINVFGQEAGPGLLTLLSEGRDGLQEYTDAVTDTNSAFEAAEIQMDTVQGSIDQMKSVVEAVSISFVKEFEPALRGGIDVVTEFLRGVNALPGPVKIFIGTLTVGIPIVIAASSAVTALAGAFGVLLGPVGIALAAVAGVTAAIAGISGAIKESRIEYLTEEFGALSEQLGVSAEEIEAVQNALYHGGLGGFTDAAEQVKALSENLGIAESKIIEMGLASENVSDAYKDQLRELLKQVEAQEEQEAIMQEELAISDDFIGRAKEREAAELRANKIIEDRAALIEQENLKELSRVEGVITARKKANADYEKEIENINNLQKVGVIDQIEALQRQKKEADKLAESLVAIGYVTRADGKEGYELLVQAIEKSQALGKEIETLTEKETAYADKTSDALSMLADYQKKLFDLNATEAKSLEYQEAAAISAIDKFDAAKDATDALKDKVHEYFDAVRKSREETTVFGDVTQKEFDDVVDATDKITNSMLGVFSAIQSGDNVIGAVGSSLGTIGDIAEKTGTKLGLAFSNILGPAGLALQIVQTIVGMFKQAQSDAIDYQQTISNLSNQIAQQTLENRKTTLDAEYEAEVDNIRRIEEAKLDSIEKERSAKVKSLSQYLSEELQAVLIQQGILETTTDQRYKDIYDDIIKTSESAGITMTESEKQRIKEILDAEKKAEEEAAAAKKKAEDSAIAAEKEYKNALAQWEYDKAVADRRAAITTAQINKQRALSELSWWDVYVDHKDRDISKMFNSLISQISAMPLPNIPKFKTGGVIPGSSYSGDRVIMRGNSGEGIFTPDQMEALGLMINGGGKTGNRMMTLVFEFSGRQIAEEVVSYIDNGKVRFKVLAK
jgi:TP901 family phage tail tape measure protein